MGDLPLKQFSVVVMLSATLMNTLSHLFFVFNLFVDSLQLFPYYVSVIMRFGDLGLIIGSFALYLVIKTQKNLRAFAILFAIIGIIRFLMKEFSFIMSQDVFDTVLLIMQLSMMCFFFNAMSQNRVPLLNIKSKVSITLLTLFGFSSIILTIIPQLGFSWLSLFISAFSSLVYILYQIGIYIYFQEWYKEAYTYHNACLLNI
jgi:hypothetical protein